MNRLTAFALFQSLLFVMFTHSFGKTMTIRVFMINAVEGKTAIGIHWPGKTLELLQHGKRNEFSYKLMSDKEDTVKCKVQLNLEEKDAAEKEFTAFKGTEYPPENLKEKIDGSTFGIYYVVKKDGLYLWDYESHLASIRGNGRYTQVPKEEHLSIVQEW